LIEAAHLILTGNPLRVRIAVNHFTDISGIEGLADDRPAISHLTAGTRMGKYIQGVLLDLLQGEFRHNLWRHARFHRLDETAVITGVTLLVVLKALGFGYAGVGKARTQGRNTDTLFLQLVRQCLGITDNGMLGGAVGQTPSIGDVAANDLEAISR
jgi:hypothetical protein